VALRQIDRARYGEPVRKLVEDAFAAGRPRTLSFGVPAAEVRAALAALDAAALCGGRRARDARAVDRLRAGLWLLHDFMDEGHGIVQDIAGSNAAYWHGIVHRREPDPANARYWFRQVGTHPIFAELACDSLEIVAGRLPLSGIVENGFFRPGPFIDLCTCGLSGDDEQALLALQRREWELLFDHEWYEAMG
jgi:hypothetical protein